MDWEINSKIRSTQPEKPSATGTLVSICLLPAPFFLSFTLLSDSTKMSCCEVTGVTTSSRVVSGDLWQIIGHGEELVVEEHAA